jgi:ribonuclease J
VLGQPTDSSFFKEAGKKGVLAYIGDSTNAEIDGFSGSESDVREGLSKTFKNCKGAIAVTIFASNVSRIKSVYAAAHENGRSVCIVGRSLHNMTGAARDTGLLDEGEVFVSEEEASQIPSDQILYLVTGSQGEARAQLARISRGDHPTIKLGKGDTVIFSARPIPGNEQDINHVKNNLSAGGVSIISPSDTTECIHVSGHPCREEISEMLGWLRPNTVVPVHGERTQIEAHAKYVKKCQIKNVVVPNNGSLISLEADNSKILDHVHSGLLAVGARKIISSDHPSIIQRRKLQYTGSVHVSVVIDKRGDLLARPKITTIGIIDPEDPDDLEFETDLEEEAADILRDIDKADLTNDHAVQEDIRIGIRRVVLHETGLKAKTTVHVIRV